ncbi:MAG TPA: hypothetical protein VLE47_03910 [Candidatus Saccharimonadales bacterium]|nr:hypothetical protein [Candidatus Saccharimonadales bacterium]
MAKLVKTTIRIDAELKKAAEREALERDTTFQSVVNTAVEEHFKGIKKEQNVSPGFESWVDKYIDKNKTALEELANT